MKSRSSETHARVHTPHAHTFVSSPHLVLQNLITGPQDSLLSLHVWIPPLSFRNYFPQKSIPEEAAPGTRSCPGWSWDAGPLASSLSSQDTPLAHVSVPAESVQPSKHRFTCSLSLYWTPSLCTLDLQGGS